MADKFKLSFVNNWERYEYYVNGKRISDISSVEIRKNGKYECVVPVIKALVHNTYSDCGHSTTVSTFEFFIETEVHGVIVSVPLRSYVLFNRNAKTEVFVELKDITFV